jgi:Pyruvate/2-oxoacid:ferredoxin oxidoreductase delta subunit
MPSKTPYFRVLAVEDSLPTQPTTHRVPVGEAIPDPRQVLPIDILSQMVSREPLIGVSECYCRLARENRGGGSCEHPRETCFTFNELAQTLIETGLARQVDSGEALRILRHAEEHGLVHNVDNCQGQLKALCNCCPCCCPAIKSFKAGVRNVNGASQYIAYRLDQQCTDCGDCIQVCPVEALSAGEGHPQYNPERCIGCGLCASRCPEKAIEMRMRDELPKIPQTNDRLWATIRNEAILTMAKKTIVSLFRPSRP